MSAQIAAPTPGDYVLRVLNFASVASSYTLTATLFDSRTVDSREVPGLIENWTLTCEKDGRVLRAGRRRPRSAGKVDVDLRQALDHWLRDEPGATIGRSRRALTGWIHVSRPDSRSSGVSGDPRIRAATPRDDVLPVVRAAFGEEGEQVARLWAELEQSDALRASLVAEHAGQVVGHVGLSHAWLDARRELVDVWLLSPLSVAPDRQGRGVGTRLVAAAVEAARSGGAPLLFLEGDPGYYGHRGFERASAHGFRPASARTPVVAFQVVRFAGHQEWMTGQVIYRDVWWRHDSAGLRDPLLAQIEEGTR